MRRENTPAVVETGKQHPDETKNISANAHKLYLVKI
jgi:hypothetical protein